MIGKLYRAVTTTKTEQRTIIEVTAIEKVTESGTYVWGYPQRRNARPRQNMSPRLYFMAK